jgi:hypothetical protein
MAMGRRRKGGGDAIERRKRRKKGKGCRTWKNAHAVTERWHSPAFTSLIQSLWRMNWPGWWRLPTFMS